MTNMDGPICRALTTSVLKSISDDNTETPGPCLNTTSAKQGAWTLQGCTTTPAILVHVDAVVQSAKGLSEVEYR